MKLASRTSVISAAITAATLAGTVSAGWLDGHKRDASLEIDHLSGKPLVVETTNGAVTVRKSEGGPVRIEAQIRSKSKERLDQAQVIATRVDDGALEVTVIWPGGEAKSGDGCSFEIFIPDVSQTTIDTSNGGVELAGLSGEARLDTSNGAITVHEHAGPVFADTSNGAVTLVNIAGPVRADTSNGTIKIQGVADSVVADTSNGSISIVLADNSEGPVEADTSNGSISIEVGQSFAGVMEVATTNGRVVTSGATERVQSKLDPRATDGELVFGGGGPESSASTSNGSIKVTVRGS